MNNRWRRTLFVRLGGLEVARGMNADGASDSIRPAILDRGVAITAEGGALRSRLGNLVGIALLALLCLGFMSCTTPTPRGDASAHPPVMRRCRRKVNSYCRR